METPWGEFDNNKLKDLSHKSYPWQRLYGIALRKVKNKNIRPCKQILLQTDAAIKTILSVARIFLCVPVNQALKCVHVQCNTKAFMNRNFKQPTTAESAVSNQSG